VRKAFKDNQTMSLKFAFKLYCIGGRMMFGRKNPFQKEYDEALDLLQERGHWLYLYDSLAGPNGEQVCAALKAWLEAYQAKKECQDEQVLSDEKRLKRELHLWIYGEFTEGVHGYVSDDE
jgi:hypothetical protein